MATIFTRIINGDLPGAFVWRDDLCVAFLSINPISEGHILVVPRQEIDHWLDCPDELRNHLMGVAKTIGDAMQAEWNPTRVGLIIAGLDVPHLHIHLMPVSTPEDLDFARAGDMAPVAELELVAQRIRTHLS